MGEQGKRGGLIVPVRAGAALACMLLVFINTNSVVYPQIALIWPLAREAATWFGVAVMGAIVACANYRPRLLARRWWNAAALVATAGYVACCLAGFALRSPALVVAGALLDTVAEAWLFVLVYVALSQVGKERRSLVAAVGCLAAYLTEPLVQRMDPSAALATNALCLAAIFLLTRPLVARPLDELAAAAPQAELAAANPLSFLPANHLLYVTILFFSTVQGIALALSSLDGSGLEPSFAFAALAIVLAARLIRKRELNADVLFGVFALLVLAGMFLIPSNRMLPGALMLTTESFLDAGSACFNLLLALLVANIAARNGIAAVPTAALAIGLAWAGIGVGTLLGYGSAQLTGASDAALAPVSFVVAMAFAAYCFVALKRFSFEGVVNGIRTAVTPEPPAAPASTVHERCERVARERGLTPRETEVLELLASGRTVGVIREKLTISLNTARFHTKNVYAKLGVHSQQELIDLVDEAGREK
ncbi:LuxR C-terminal-related transcriptional regulator [Arabiibacter massiliensis]|uniref:LuxR C-terminal-related transcriptional regulator n=1 Tax=Arabiibacter massiliensis TaxID=1870985 RepID=UPI00155B07B7|nr:LuxR C-terminal-related transcriptional regulator [Arabiibacter massiliensis]